MTPAEIAAFNLGIEAVLELARQSSEAMKERLVEKPTRYNFAIGALEGLAEAGELLKVQATQEGAVQASEAIVEVSPRERV